MSRQANGAYLLNMGIKIFCLSLLVNLFIGGCVGYAAEDAGPDLFGIDYDYLQSGYWDRNDRSGLVSKSCREAQRRDCAKAISALKAFTNTKSSSPKVLDDILAEDLRDLKDTPLDSPIYPTLVYWISRITPLIVVDAARHDRLTTMGIQYRRSEIAGDLVSCRDALENASLGTPGFLLGTASLS